MKPALSFIAIFIFAFATSAQKSFRLTDASKTIDVGIEIGVAADEQSSPPATFSFYRKGATKPFQTISVDGIDMFDAEPKANLTLGYDEQSVVNFDDFNFDGVEDMALNDGNGGGYGGPSYQIYLYSRSKKLFVLSEPFTDLNQGDNLGFMDIDSKNRMIYRRSKDGCCWHQTEGFRVIGGLPKKVYEKTEDVRNEKRPDIDLVTITTRRLVKGKWQKRVKYAKASVYYKE